MARPAPQEFRSDPALRDVYFDFDKDDIRPADAKALEAESRRKDEFIAILGHELRNPLAPLRTGLEILEQALHRPLGFRAVYRRTGRDAADCIGERPARIGEDQLRIERVLHRGTGDRPRHGRRERGSDLPHRRRR